MIAGRFRSRRLKSVPGMTVRPTPDRLREALFNVLAARFNGLAGHIEGCVFVDAFAGSGAVGIEALSRGAKHVILIERNPQALAIIAENLASLGIRGEVTVARGNVLTLVSKYAADVAFVDPPYEQESAYSASLDALGGTCCRLAIAQHSSRLTLEPAYRELTKTRVLRQGDNSLSFFEREESGRG